MHVSVEARSQCQESPSVALLRSVVTGWSFCFVVRQDLSLTLERNNLARLTGQQAPGLLLPLPFQCEDCKRMPPHLGFYLDVRDPNRPSCLAQQAHYSLSLLPSPSVHFHQAPSSYLNIFCIACHYLTATAMCQAPGEGRDSLIISESPLGLISIEPRKQIPV